LVSDLSYELRASIQGVTRHLREFEAAGFVVRVDPEAPARYRVSGERTDLVEALTRVVEELERPVGGPGVK